MIRSVFYNLCMYVFFSSFLLASHNEGDVLLPDSQAKNRLFAVHRDPTGKEVIEAFSQDRKHLQTYFLGNKHCKTLGVFGDYIYVHDMLTGSIEKGFLLGKEIQLERIVPYIKTTERVSMTTHPNQQGILFSIEQALLLSEGAKEEFHKDFQPGWYYLSAKEGAKDNASPKMIADPFHTCPLFLPDSDWVFYKCMMTPESYTQNIITGEKYRLPDSLYPMRMSFDPTGQSLVVFGAENAHWYDLKDVMGKNERAMSQRTVDYLGYVGHPNHILFSGSKALVLTSTRDILIDLTTGYIHHLLNYFGGRDKIHVGGISWKGKFYLAYHNGLCILDPYAMIPKFQWFKDTSNVRSSINYVDDVSNVKVECMPGQLCFLIDGSLFSYKELQDKNDVDSFSRWDHTKNKYLDLFLQKLRDYLPYALLFSSQKPYSDVRIDCVK